MLVEQESVEQGVGKTSRLLLTDIVYIVTKNYYQYLVLESYLTNSLDKRWYLWYHLLGSRFFDHLRSR